MSDTYPPCKSEAGTLIEFTAGDSRYPSDDYSYKFALNNGMDVPLVTDGEADGDNFTVSLTTPDKAGTYQWGEIYERTGDGAKFRGRSGCLIVLPSILETATQSMAAQILARLETAILDGSSSRRSSVSFNGQSVSWTSPGEFNEIYTFWKAQVIKERNAAGCGNGGLIAPTFLRPSPHVPLGRGGCC